MGEEQLDLGLGKPVVVPSFRYDALDELVVPFARGLVRRAIRVCEEGLRVPSLDLAEKGGLGARCRLGCRL